MFVFLSKSNTSRRMHDALTGRTAKLASVVSSSMTSLQREILQFVLIILGVAMSLAILVLILDFARYVVSGLRVFSMPLRSNLSAS